MKQPNVVFIDCHDLGDWIGCYDRPHVSTPNLDRLAFQGARFSQFIATAPICIPSRVGLYCSQMPHMIGVWGQFPYADDAVCMARYFQDAGYETVLSNRLMILNDPSWAGFSRVIEGKAGVEVLAERFLRGEAPSIERPFFLQVSFSEVHRPFGLDYDPDLAERMVVPPDLPDCSEVRKDLAALCRQIGELDKKVGRILNALDDRGLADETVVVFTTEHGVATARAKHTLYDAGIRTTLLMRYPPEIAPGAVYGDLISNLDLLPTLMELCGLEEPDGILGRSFRGLFSGVGWAGRSVVFSEQTWGRRSGNWYYTPMRCVRSDQFKLIRNFARVPNYVDNGWVNRFQNRREVVQALFSRPAPERELYSLADDPYELNNVADDPRFSKVRDDLEGQLTAFLEETEDPILMGFVPNREGHPDVPQWIKQSDGTFLLEADREIYHAEQPFD